MEYTSQLVENLLRNYYSLQVYPGSEFAEYTLDLHNSLMIMKRRDKKLYSTIVGVFVNGTPIQEQANKDDVSRMHVSRRLDDGLNVLTMIMNGELYAG